MHGAQRHPSGGRDDRGTDDGGTDDGRWEDAFVEPITGIRFLEVPTGWFTMGADDIGSDSKPPHIVEVSDFWLAETPATNAQYRVLLEAKGLGRSMASYQGLRSW